MFDITDKSVFFLQWHMENSFNEILNQFPINNIEWMEWDEVRAYGTVKGANIIILFPMFKESDDYYLPQNSS